MRLVPLAAAAVLAVALAAPAASQSVDVRGKWTANVSGRTCTLDLSGDTMFGRYRGSSFGCQGDLFSVAGYQIRGGQVVLVGMGDRDLATLTPRGDELVGTTASGAQVTLRREGAPPVVSARPGFGGQGGGCVAYGQNGGCAEPADTRAPMANSSVRTLTVLNLRGSPSLTGPLLGAFPRNACIRVFECRRGGDGAEWCRTELLGEQGWIAKQVSRPNGGGQMITFTNRC